MSVTFQGVVCSPMGDATLAINNNKLVVSNIGSSGLDGVMIHIPEGSGGGNNIKVDYNLSMNSAASKVVKTLLGRNNNGQVLATLQNIVHRDSEKIYYGYNGNLLAAQSNNLIGSSNGTPVFDIQVTNDYNPISTGIPSAIFWVPFGVWDFFWVNIVAPLVKEMGYDDIQVEIIDLGNNEIDAVITHQYDPTTYAVNVIPTSQVFNVDTWGIKKKTRLTTSQGATPTTLTKNIAWQYQLRDVGQFEITNITLSPVPIT